MSKRSTAATAASSTLSKVRPHVVVDETSVVWEALHRFGNGPLGATRPKPKATPETSVAEWFVAVVMMALVAVVMTALVAVVFLASTRTPSVTVTCRPIAYAIDGAPPTHVVDEFRAAVGEISRRSGLRFAPAAGGAAKLTVHWRIDVRIKSGALRPSADDRKLLGSAVGRWRVVGTNRELLGAAIDLDATRNWALGWSRGDSLRAVMVHELGHVVGLGHTSDQRSFMYPEALSHNRQWTTEDLDALATLGKQAGCAAAAA
ncbi:MAG TPA: matrixin family metalloprotease [Acidimicrobiales bacterium]|nr:matrixin family metalloprotease [Acidimicrobiales bacterium]